MQNNDQLTRASERVICQFAFVEERQHEAIERELQKKAGDVVVHSAVDGITDIAFENRREGKVVSVYFTGDEKGKKLYQDWAAKFAKDTHIELVNEFSHTGLARISMSWNRYWQQTEKQETKQLER